MHVQRNEARPFNFGDMARHTSDVLGSPWALVLACVIVFVWGLAGVLGPHGGAAAFLFRGCRPRKEIVEQRGASDGCQQQREQEDRDHRTRTCPLTHLDRWSAWSIDRLVVHRDDIRRSRLYFR